MKSGDIYPTNKWGDILIQKYVNHKNVYIKFLNTGVERVTRSELIMQGIAKDPTYPTLFGAGFIGEGPYESRKNRSEYVAWKGVLERCYSQKLHQKRPTYRECTVDTQWHNYQEFAEWCQWQKGFTKGAALDKDLLFPSNKKYSPETCCFLPRELNIVIQIGDTANGNLPGVYKDGHSLRVCTTDVDGSKLSKRFFDEKEAFHWYCEAKDKRVVAVAQKYYDILDERAIYALENFNTISRWS